MAQAVEAHLYMVDQGLQQGGTTLTEKTRSITGLDTNDYNGNPVYLWEVVAKVGGGTGTYTLRLAGDTVDIVTVTTTASNETRLRSSSFTPTTGDNNYSVWIKNSGADNSRCHDGLIIVQQDSTATKTSFLIPITGRPSDFTNTSYGDVPGDRQILWLYTAANWNNATFTLDATLQNNTGGQNTLVELANTGNTQRGEVSIGGTAWARGESSAMTLTDAEVHKMRHRVTGGTGSIGRVSIRVVISTLDKAEFYVKVASSAADTNGDGISGDWTTSSTTDVNNEGQRKIFNKTLYGNISAIYFEGTGLDASPNGSIKLQDMGTVDVAGTATTLDTATITSSSTQRIRGSDIQSSITNDNRLIAGLNTITSGALDGCMAWLIVVVAAPAAGGTHPGWRTRGGWW